MTGFGSALKAERARCGLTLESVAEKTKVSIRHLEALEAENFGALPGGVFRRGIARAYLLAVGLDESAWMQSFQQSLDSCLGPSGHASPEPDGWAAFAENVRRSRRTQRRSHNLRWLGVLAMMIALALTAWAAWHFILQARLPRPDPPAVPISDRGSPHIPASR